MSLRPIISARDSINDRSPPPPQHRSTGQGAGRGAAGCIIGGLLCRLRFDSRLPTHTQRPPPNRCSNGRNGHSHSPSCDAFTTNTRSAAWRWRSEAIGRHGRSGRHPPPPPPARGDPGRDGGGAAERYVRRYTHGCTQCMSVHPYLLHANKIKRQSRRSTRRSWTSSPPRASRRRSTRRQVACPSVRVYECPHLVGGGTYECVGGDLYVRVGESPSGHACL